MAAIFLRTGALHGDRLPLVIRFIILQPVMADALPGRVVTLRDVRLAAEFSVEWAGPDNPFHPGQGARLVALDPAGDWDLPLQLKEVRAQTLGPRPGARTYRWAAVSTVAPTQAMLARFPVPTPNRRLDPPPRPRPAVNPKLPTPGEISLGDLVTELGGSLHPLERPRVRFTTEGGFRLEPW